MTIEDLKQGTLSLNTLIIEGEKIFGVGSFVEVIDKKIAIFFDGVKQENIRYADYRNCQYAN